MKLSRRNFLTGAALAIASPAIIKASSLMPVRNRLILPSNYRINYYMNTNTGDVLAWLGSKQPPAGFVPCDGRIIPLSPQMKTLLEQFEYRVPNLTYLPEYKQ